MCGNSRGITFLAQTGKILSRIMLDCLVENVCSQVIPENCGFTHERLKIELDIFCETCSREILRETNATTQVVIDLTKTSERVKREAQ